MTPTETLAPATMARTLGCYSADALEDGTVAVR